MDEPTMNPPLTRRTRQLIELITDEAVKARVLALFASPVKAFGPPERSWFAVIKLAMAGPEHLKNAEEWYRIDPRDLLMNAGFAFDLDAHEVWCRSVLQNADK
jgi:hypothetical protein